MLAVHIDLSYNGCFDIEDLLISFIMIKTGFDIFFLNWFELGPFAGISKKSSVSVSEARISFRQ